MVARIIKRGDVWYCDFRDETGRRIQRRLSENQRIAQKLADELELARRTKRLGLLPLNGKIEEFKPRYFEFCQMERALNTQYRNRKAFDMMDKSFPAVVLLKEITPEFMERLKFRWKEEGRPASIIARSIKALKTAMRKAEEWKYVEKQDWSTVKVKESAGRLLFYSMEELDGLLKICHGDWLTIALLMSRAGLRSGEVRHLCFEDLDFSRRTIYIHEKFCDECDECHNAGDVWRPKGWGPTKPRARWIDMPSDLETYLKRLPKGSGWILRPEVREFGVFATYFRRLIRNAGLAGSPHTLRHTYASHLASEGVSLQVIAELLGHSNIKATLIYAHLMPHARRFGVDKLPALASNLHPSLASSAIPSGPEKNRISDGSAKKRNHIVGTT